MTARAIDTSRDFRILTGVLFLALASYLIQIFVFTTEYRPDEWRALDVFLLQFAGGMGFTEELWMRVCLTLVNAGLVLLLHAIGFIDKRTILVALIWPLTLFLFSKIYWEFFVFPLCLVRLDLGRRDAMLFIAALIGLLAVTGEANLGVILVWRLVLLAQNLGMRWTAPLGTIGLGVLLDALMRSGNAASLPLIGSELARFSWTRDIVNPEYSIFETAVVFLTSFHFFSLHGGAYWIDAGFSLLVLAVIFNSRDAWARLRTHAHIVFALVAVIFFFTAVTHAFQNARYYFFFLPVLALVLPEDRVVPVACLGLLHVLLLGLSL